jgi:hypothetical protein
MNTEEFRGLTMKINKRHRKLIFPVLGAAFLAGIVAGILSHPAHGLLADNDSVSVSEVGAIE